MEAGKPYYALITPLEREVIPPTPGQPGVPHPSHPIVLPGTPENPIVIPPGGIGPGSPEQPIYLPPYPDNALPPHPDNTLPPPSPPYPSHPIVFPPGLPATPEHPIAIPPTEGLPPLVPAHPIVVPPDGTLPKPPEGAEKGADGVVVLLPHKMPPPSGVPGDYVPAILWYGPGTLPVQVWLPPAATQKYTPKEHKGRRTREEKDEAEAEARYKEGNKAY